MRKQVRRPSPVTAEERRPPEVSVVMTVRNGERYVGAAVESICQQTLEDWALIVVDDGSTDATAEIIAAVADPRVVLFRRPALGRVPALNFALAQCAGRYVANLDADDVALRDRLRRSVDYLDAHPEVVAVGAAREPYLPPVLRRPRRLPVRDAAIRWSFLLRNPMFNSSITYRRSALEAVGGFAPAYSERLHDADLLLRLGPLGRLHNLPGALSLRRLHADQHFASLDSARRGRLHATMRLRAATELGFPRPLRPLAWLVAAVGATRSLVMITLLGRNGRVDRRSLPAAGSQLP